MNFSKKYLLFNSVIIYNNYNTIIILIDFVLSFKNIFINLNKTVNIFKN